MTAGMIWTDGLIANWFSKVHFEGQHILVQDIKEVAFVAFLDLGCRVQTISCFHSQ